MAQPGLHIRVTSLAVTALALHAYTKVELQICRQSSVGSGAPTTGSVMPMHLLGIVLYTGATSGGPEGQIAAVLAAAVCGVFMAIMWAPSIGAMVARPFMNLYDGGSREIEARLGYRGRDEMIHRDDLVVEA